MDLKREFIEEAYKLGFDEAAFVSVEPFSQWEKDARGKDYLSRIFADPRALLPEASCIIVLYRYAPPFLPFPEGYAQYPNYYAVSHAAYLAARELAAILREKGAAALHTDKIPQRQAALRHTGFIGENGLMFHPRFGSFFNIQTIITNAFLPEKYDKSANCCLHCGKCALACPARAIRPPLEAGLCVRFYLMKTDTTGLNPVHMTQLVGCEECQKACPLNERYASVSASPFQYEPFLLSGILEGNQEQLAAAEKVIGKNMARLLPAQAALFAQKRGL